MDRRGFLRLLALGLVGSQVDVDKLLWVPGEKKIFLPTPSIYKLSDAQIVALEMERILPQIRTLFERDDIFYKFIEKRHIPLISSRSMRVPLSFGPKK